MTTKAKYFVSYPIDGSDAAPSTYDITFNTTEKGNRKTTVRYSGDGVWTASTRGKTALVIKDHGNGVDVKFTNRPKVELDYSDMEQLYLALDMYFAEEPAGVPEIQKFIPASHIVITTG